MQQTGAESPLSYASDGAAYSDIQSKVIGKKKEVVGSDLGNQILLNDGYRWLFSFLAAS